MALSADQISTLLDSSKCFCNSEHSLLAMQTYVIAYAAGLGTDPNELQGAAPHLYGLSIPQLNQIRAYLLASIGGQATDADSIAAEGACSDCGSELGWSKIQTYLLSTDPSGPGITDPSELQAAASEFEGLSNRKLLSTQVYLLAYLAGVSDWASYLLDDTKCIRCLSEGTTNAAITSLINLMEENGGLVPTPPPPTCVDVPEDQVPIISGTYVAGVLSTIDIEFPQVCCEPNGYSIYGIDSGVVEQTGTIPAANAGLPYSVSGVDVSGIDDAIGLYVVQNCIDGDSDPSNRLFNEIPAPSRRIFATGAGDSNANGYYLWDQDRYDDFGEYKYVNAASSYYILFKGGAGGVEGNLYNNLGTSLYTLPVAECFPHGDWTKEVTDSGTLPVPNAVFLSYGASVTRTWAARVVTNGGTVPSNNSIFSISDFLEGVYADTGLRSKMKSINVIAPDSLIAAITPLLKSSGLDPWTNNNFLAADLTVNGLVGNGTTKYLNTGIIPSAAELTLTSAGLVVYLYSTGAVANAMGMGCLSAAGPNFPYFALAPQWAGTGFYACWKLVNVDQDYIQWASPAPSTGYYAGVRVASNSIKSYFARSTSAHAQLDTASGAQTAIAVESIRPLFAFAVNNIGTPANYSDCRHSFFAVCLGLTAAESATLYGLILTMRTALGGGYV